MDLGLPKPVVQVPVADINIRSNGKHSPTSFSLEFWKAGLEQESCPRGLRDLTPKPDLGVVPLEDKRPKVQNTWSPGRRSYEEAGGSGKRADLL